MELFDFVRMRHSVFDARTQVHIINREIASTGNNSEEATDLSETKAITTSAMDYFKTAPNNNGDAFGTTTTTATATATTINNNKLITNNNANIKNERFSPPHQLQLQNIAAQSNGAHTDAHSSNSR